MYVNAYFLRNITLTCWFLWPVRATRSDTILPDGIESDDSDKDQYRPEDTDHMQEGSDDNEPESEEEDVLSKKGKRFKPGRREIAAVRVTVPTTGSKSAAEHSKRRERSPRSVPCNLYLYHLH